MKSCEVLLDRWTLTWSKMCLLPVGTSQAWKHPNGNAYRGSDALFRVQSRTSKLEHALLGSSLLQREQILPLWISRHPESTSKRNNPAQHWWIDLRVECIFGTRRMQRRQRTKVPVFPLSSAITEPFTKQSDSEHPYWNHIDRWWSVSLSNYCRGSYGHGLENEPMWMNVIRPTIGQKEISGEMNRTFMGELLIWFSCASSREEFEAHNIRNAKKRNIRWHKIFE